MPKTITFLVKNFMFLVKNFMFLVKKICFPEKMYYICLRSKKIMETQLKKTLNRRLLYIYIAYFTVLAVGVLHGWWQLHKNGVPEQFHPGLHISLAWLWVGASARVVILVLVAMMINMLRRAIRDERPLPKGIVVCTRVIAGLLVVATLSSSAAMRTTGTFPINYWNLFIAILILFSAEIFTIGMKLGEEQKLTI